MSEQIENSIVLPHILHQIGVATEYEAAFIQAASVRRYENRYAEGIFFDTVLAHIVRTVMAAKNPRQRRILSIHDLPEIRDVADLDAVTKSVDPVLAEAVGQEELEIARSLLSEEDFKLYCAFEEISPAIRDGRSLAEVDPDIFHSWIIDKNDSNKLFHYQLIHWMRSERFNKTDIPDPAALTHTFNQYRTIIVALRPVEFELKFDCHDLLVGQLRFIYLHWNCLQLDIEAGFVDAKVPEVILQQLDEVRHLI